MNHLLRAWAASLLAGLSVLTAVPAAAQDDGWWLNPDARIEVSVLSAQTTTRDEDLVIDGEAINLRGQVGLALEKGDKRFRIEADRIEVIRIGEGRNNIARDRFTATFETRVGKDFELRLMGRHFDDVVTVEAADTDEWTGAARLSFEPRPEHRVRIEGSWRERDYANGPLAETSGEGPRVDAEYRRRFGRYHYLQFDLRGESIGSDDPRRGYERESAGVAYTRPITLDLRVRPALEIIKTRFDGRLAPEGQLRRDTLVVPEVELLWWPGKWRIEAEAKYIFFNSNEPVREREGYRLTLSVGYAF